MTAWAGQDDCPVCGQQALIALGVRYDRLHRWRPWITTITHLALCSACDALVTTEGMGATQRPARGPRGQDAPGVALRPLRQAAAPAGV